MTVGDLRPGMAVLFDCGGTFLITSVRPYSCVSWDGGVEIDILAIDGSKLEVLRDATKADVDIKMWGSWWFNGKIERILS